jgi:hypothetical protein
MDLLAFALMMQGSPVPVVPTAHRIQFAVSSSFEFILINLILRIYLIYLHMMKHLPLVYPTVILNIYQG